VNLYPANPCMVAELRDEPVGMPPSNPDRPEFVALGVHHALGVQDRYPWEIYSVLQQSLNRAYNARVSKVIFKPNRIFRNELK